MPLCTRHSARPTHFTHGRPALQRKPRSGAADNTPPAHTFDALRDSAVTIGKGDIKVESHAAGMHGPAMRKHQHTRFAPFPAEIEKLGQANFEKSLGKPFPPRNRSPSAPAIQLIRLTSRTGDRRSSANRAPGQLTTRHPPTPSTHFASLPSPSAKAISRSNLMPQVCTDPQCGNTSTHYSPPSPLKSERPKPQRRSKFVQAHLTSPDHPSASIALSTAWKSNEPTSIGTIT